MARRNNKTVFAVLGGVVVLFVLAAGIYGFYNEFTPMKIHESDKAHAKEVMLLKHGEQDKKIADVAEALAAQSTQIKQNSLQDHIRWLEQQIDEIEKEYGDDPNRMPSTVKKRYKKYLRDLEDARTALQKIQEKM